MIVTEQEVDRVARNMLTQHRSRAAIVAGERLNECIDRGDWEGRDTWARIVCRIHELSAPNPLGAVSLGLRSSTRKNAIVYAVNAVAPIMKQEDQAKSSR
jgi:hypothetical protein